MTACVSLWLGLDGDYGIWYGYGEGSYSTTLADYQRLGDYCMQSVAVLVLPDLPLPRRTCCFKRVESRVSGWETDDGPKLTRDATPSRNAGP